MNDDKTQRSNLLELVNLDIYPLQDPNFQKECKDKLDALSVLVLAGFLNPSAIDALKKEGKENQHLAYYTASNHNIYLKTSDPAFTKDHPRNREVTSSKGCITTDQIPENSFLHTLYNAPDFRDFLCKVLGEAELHEYADPLSSINMQYASQGQKLVWHFDNSSFAITLLIQKPKGGGEFEYVRNVRNAESGKEDYELAGEVLNGEVPPISVSTEPGALVLFRGSNSMHRVTATQGDQTRILAVLAYNAEPGISLSESARRTFFGRIG